MAGDARVTQLVAETLTLPGPPAARLTQLVAETLGSLVAATSPARLTQLVAETLTRPSGPQLTQLVVETLSQPPPSPVRVSQAPLEVLDQYPTATRVSQVPLELLQQHTAPKTPARVSQAPLEIIYPFGCYVPGPLPPSACDDDFPIDAAGSGGACATPLLP